MKYDDDAIERALAALPLEETPADLRPRILAATIRRPAPALSSWELSILGVTLALATWLVLAVWGSPLTGGAAVSREIGTFVDRIVAELGAALTPTTCLWLAIGVSAAIWLSLIPAGRDGVEA